MPSTYLLFLIGGFMVSDFSLAATSDPIDLLFKARGLQAKERVESILNSIPKSKSDLPRLVAVPTKKLCEYILEFGFQTIVNPEQSKITYVRDTNGDATFKLIFLGKDEKNFAQVSMTYSKDAKTQALTVNQLSGDSGAVILSKYPTRLAIKVENCSFDFPMNDPIAVSIVPSNKSSTAH